MQNFVPFGHSVGTLEALGYSTEDTRHLGIQGSLALKEVKEPGHSRYLDT